MGEISPVPGLQPPLRTYPFYQQNTSDQFFFPTNFGDKRGTNIMGFFGRYALLVLFFPPPVRYQAKYPLSAFVCLLPSFIFPPLALPVLNFRDLSPPMIRISDSHGCNVDITARSNQPRAIPVTNQNHYRHAPPYQAQKINNGCVSSHAPPPTRHCSQLPPAFIPPK
jgi:hypothetical protein